MNKINAIKKEQILSLQEHCIKKSIKYESMECLLESQKIKKLQKRNHYMQQTIDMEIEKSLGL